MSSLFSKPLSAADTQTIIATKLQWILQNASPQKIILFGSAARGEMTSGSDVDLIIIFRNTIDKVTQSKKLWQTRPIDDWPHDLILLTTDEFDYGVNLGGDACWLASREGIVLFMDNKLLL